MQVQLKARDHEIELSQIKSVDLVTIDHREVLKIKRGDLSIIPGEVYRCNPTSYSISNVPLILKRAECVDRRIFD
jgi:hypothetical protein